MDVRHATAADTDGIHRVAEAAWETDYPDVLTRETATEGVDEWYDEDGIREALEISGSALLVAVSDGTVQGFAHTFRETEAEVGDVLRLYVHPESRRDGVGTALLSTAVENLAAEGAKRVQAMVLAGNEQGQSFYESHGFERVGESETRIAGETYPEYTYERRTRS